jgi:hypothetical protein
MWVKVKIAEGLAIGSVLSYSEISSSWVLAQNLNTPVGVLEQITQDVITSETFGVVRFAGTAYALADRDIPDQGGEMTVINGKVYVDNAADHCGIIAPLPHGQPSRVAGDLVMVYIR